MIKLIRRFTAILGIGISSITYSQDFSSFQQHFNQFLEPNIELGKNFNACYQPLKDFSKTKHNIGFSEEIDIVEKIISDDQLNNITVSILADNIKVASLPTNTPYYKELVTTLKKNGLTLIFESTQNIPSPTCINCSYRVSIFKKPNMNFEAESQKVKLYLATVNKLSNDARNCIDDSIDKFEKTVSQQPRQKQLEEIANEFSLLFPEKKPTIFKNMTIISQGFVIHDRFGSYTNEDWLNKEIIGYTPEQQEQIRSIFKTIVNTKGGLFPKNYDYVSEKRHSLENIMNWERNQYHDLELFVGEIKN